MSAVAPTAFATADPLTDEALRAVPPHYPRPSRLAEPLKVSINGQEMLAEVKAFSTGSFGWYLNGKTTVQIDGKNVSVQIGMNLTIVGSKDLPGKPAAE